MSLFNNRDTWQSRPKESRNTRTIDAIAEGTRWPTAEKELADGSQRSRGRRPCWRRFLEMVGLHQALTRSTELTTLVLPESVCRWIPRLNRLESLELWNGVALSEGSETLIHKHCPRFKKLSIFEW